MTDDLNKKVISGRIQRFEHLPIECLKRYARSAPQDDPFVVMLSRDDWQDILKRLMHLCKKVSKVCNVEPGRLCEDFHFNPSNSQYERLEAWIAELRTVCFLDGVGCSEIRPIPEDPNAKSADLECRTNDEIVCIEVCCDRDVDSKKGFHQSILDDKGEPPIASPKQLNLAGGQDQIKRFLLARAGDKESQLASSMRGGEYQRSILAVVVNSPRHHALLDRNGIEEILRLVHEELKWKDWQHLAFITGMEDQRGQQHDCIYPHL